MRNLPGEKTMWRVPNYTEKGLKAPATQLLENSDAEETAEPPGAGTQLGQPSRRAQLGWNHQAGRLLRVVHYEFSLSI